MKDSDMELSRACCMASSLQNRLHLVAFAPLFAPHIAREDPRSRLSPGGGGGRSAATGLGRSLLLVML